MAKTKTMMTVAATSETASAATRRTNPRPIPMRGLEKVDHLFVLNMAAYNLVRMRSLGQVRP